MFDLLKKRSSVVILLAALVIIGIVIVLIGFQEKERDLPFETVERTDVFTGKNYAGVERQMIIVAQSGEIASLGNTISTDARTALDSTDFSKYFAVAVFQGAKPTLGYGVEIQRIVQRGGSVIVYARFQEPPPDFARKALVSSPYHLVKVQKGELHGNIEFVVQIDDTVISKQTHVVP